MLNGLMRILGRAGLGVGLASVVAALVPTPAAAADPGRWDLVDRSTIPLVYFQGVTSAPDGDLFFDGINTGLYRSNSQLAEEARIANVIPSEVGTAENYNHVGDITYDAADGGRILLPLECYYPGTPSGANTCQTGSIGVADPDTLQWQYYVKLDPASIKKVMWAEVSPDGSKLWTQQGNDLLVYDMSDISAANAAPVGPELEPTETLEDAVPAERHHRGHLLPRPPLRGRIDGRPRRQPRGHVPGLVDRPGGRQPAAGDRAPGRRRVRGPRRIRLARRDPPLADPADPLAPG